MNVDDDEQAKAAPKESYDFAFRRRQRRPRQNTLHV